MSELKLEFENGNTHVHPGETIRGVASWKLDQHAALIDLRLFWYTEGKGTQDVTVINTITLDHPQQEQSYAFQFALPQSPYSFSGKLISLIWAIEMVVRPGKESARQTFTMSATGEEIELQTAISK
jgi:hypothetical protein